jgi:hypothetical protein
MNQTLLAKLKALNPTEGEWRYNEELDFPFIETDEWNIDTDGISEDDHKLITLAPAMREELLKMEEERTYVRGMLRQLSALNENHEYFKCIAGLIQQSREYLRNTNPTKP